jgi:hypothetical protein
MAINTTFTLAINSGTGGLAFNASSQISSNGIVQFSETLIAAISGTLTTRSSATAGTLTIPSIGNITSSCRLDIYWSGGSVYGATVGSVSGTSVPFTGAVGTLPAVNTVITCFVPVSVAFVITGSNCQSLACGVSSPAVPATVVFATSAPANEAVANLTTAVPSYVWATGATGTNPIAGDAITQAFLSQSSATQTTTISGFGQYN